MRRVVQLVLVLALAGPCLLWAGSDSAKPLSRESRLQILRGLHSELATAKRALPRGEDPVPLDSEGQVDEEELQYLIGSNGAALLPGKRVQITKIDFRKEEIIFELNGGGKTTSKWYESIRITGSGGRTRPVTRQVAMPTGSSIALRFESPVPDMTADEVKKILATLLDFSPRSASTIYVESLPKEMQEAIKNHQVLVGMDRQLVLAAKGRPDRKVRERHGRIELEDWIYGVPPSKITFVTFQGNEVIEVKEYMPGVASEAVRAAEADSAASPIPDEPAPEAPVPADSPPAPSVSVPPSEHPSERLSEQ